MTLGCSQGLPRVVERTFIDKFHLNFQLSYENHNIHINMFDRCLFLLSESAMKRVTLHEYNRRNWSSFYIFWAFTVFVFPACDSHQENGWRQLEYITNMLQSVVMTMYGSVMILAYDKSSEGLHQGERSHGHVDGRTPLAASRRWKVKQEWEGREFIRVRRWSRSSALSRGGQWGFPLALPADCRPPLPRGSLQGDRGFHRCPGHGTPSPSLW